jgi:CubicO group peptidase (beta-lactamase class C family)
MARRGLYKVAPDDLDGSVGDKGVHSTTEDLYKWDQALYSDVLVRQDILAEAFTKGRLNNNKEVDYGFGFRITERDGKKIIYHNGLWNGFRTAIIRDVQDEITIIVLNHTNSPAKHIVVNGIQKILNGADRPYLETPEAPDHTLMGED